jgi:hypothetical protein
LLLLIFNSLFLNGICYCLRVFWCAAARMSELELEQRTNIKFLFKLGKSGNEFREIERLREKVRRERPEHFSNSSWILHYDNVPAYTELYVRECLATKQTTVLEHPA